MDWRKDEPTAISRARLLTASPEVVRTALQLRADCSMANRYTYDPDEKLDRLLLDRHDPYITLALAQFSPSQDLIAELYARACSHEPNSDLSVGIRTACLANLPAGDPIFDDAGLWLRDEMKSLISDPKRPEVRALLTNPLAGKVLAMMLKRTHHFAEIDDDSWLDLIRLGSSNPRLNVDNGDREGPDMTRFDIERGVANVVMSAPLTQKSFWIVSELLNELNPFVWSYTELNVQAALDRWLNAPIERNADDSEYTLTGLAPMDEFLCQIAAIFGKAFENRKFVIAGKADSDSLPLRCAYYANASLEGADIDAGSKRDDKAFIFSALFNTSILQSSKHRSKIEELIRGDMWGYYKRRCEQYKVRWPSFDPSPVSERGIEQDDDHTESARTPVQVSDIQPLRTEIHALSAKVARLQRDAFWGFVVIVVLMYVLG